MKVTYLFRYEEQDRVIRFLEDRLQLTLKLPLENVLPSLDLVLSHQTEARLRRKCAAEFLLYDSID